MAVRSAILKGGFVAGLLDILYAFIVYSLPPFRLGPIDVLHSVAAGWMGRDASNAGGLASALLGLITHFAIATGMAAMFVWAARRWPALAFKPVLWGLVYGFGLYVVMNYLVVPLSAAHPSQHFPNGAAEFFARLVESFDHLHPKNNVPLLIGTIFTHTVLVGLPIALIARRELMTPA